MTDRDLVIPKRVNGSLIEELERPLLASLARRMPDFVTPDALTALGVAGAAVVFVAYALVPWKPSFLWLASFGLVLNWFGDSLDGTIARERRIERPRYGFFVDHTSDFVSQLLIGFGLAISTVVRFDVACVALIAYLLLAAFSFVRGTATGTLPISFAGIGPTEVRILIATLNAVVFFYQPMMVDTRWGPLSVLDFGMLGGSASAFVVFAASAFREGKRLAEREPAPTPERDSDVRLAAPSAMKRGRRPA
jgi:phosphatidylglycerophosphate synthase